MPNRLIKVKDSWTRFENQKLLEQEIGYGALSQFLNNLIGFVSDRSGMDIERVATDRERHLLMVVKEIVMVVGR